MSAEVLVKALDPFFTTKSVGKDSGMGLPQAYGFAKQSGGTLLLKSCPGVGAQATIYLSRAAAATAAPAPDKNVQQRNASGEAVLFVEDDPLVCDVVLPALQAAGFRVIAANDGEQAFLPCDNRGISRSRHPLVI